MYIMFQTKVITARADYLRWKNEQSKKAYQERKSRPSLWPSDLFSCHRKAAYHILEEQHSIPFSDKSLAYMNGGNVIEDDTADALDWYYENCTQSFVLKNDIWSGKADFVLNHLTKKVTIIEHKATGENKFKEDKQLPKRQHVGQIGLYGRLYQELYSIKPELRLYYYGWGCEAEFDIDVKSKFVKVTGTISNYMGKRFVSKTMRINLDSEISTLESMYRTVLDGGELPKRLDKKYKGCEFMGKPSCVYYKSCWK